MDELEVATFSQSNQAKLILKMSLSNYAWYNDCLVISDEDEGYSILVGTSHIDDSIRKIIPDRIGNVTVKIKNEK